MTHALILLNPHARGGRARHLVEPLRHLLGTLDEAVPWACHEHWQDSEAAIRACPPGTRVVVIGGDGTLQRYLGALLAGRHSLGLVPAGSGNDLARAVWRDRRQPWPYLLKYALQGPVRRLDVGEVALDGGAPAPFISSLGLGFDAQVARRALSGPRLLWGRPRYLLALLQALPALRRWAVRLEVDGQAWAPGPGGSPALDVAMASLLNTPTYGGGLRIAPQARPDDGRLDLMLARSLGRAGVLRLAGQLLAGTHLANPAVATRPAQRLRLLAQAPIPVLADGNDLGDAREVQARLAVNGLDVVMGG